MPNETSVAAKLFPITKHQRKALEFIYTWIASKGRIPSQSEMEQFGGVSRGTFWNLTVKGWIVKGNYGWWPIGVTRHIRFVYPASEVINNDLCDVVVREVIQSSSKKPCTMERLADIIKVAGSYFKMSDKDRETLKWAYQELTFRDSIIKIQRMMLKPLVAALEDGHKGHHIIRHDLRTARMLHGRLQALLSRHEDSILDIMEDEHAEEAATTPSSDDVGGRIPLRIDASASPEATGEVAGLGCPDRC